MRSVVRESRCPITSASTVELIPRSIMIDAKACLRSWNVIFGLAVFSPASFRAHTPSGSKIVSTRYGDGLRALEPGGVQGLLEMLTEYAEAVDQAAAI